MNIVLVGIIMAREKNKTKTGSSKQRLQYTDS